MVLILIVTISDDETNVHNIAGVNAMLLILLGFVQLFRLVEF